jgi:excisionase family DNA binding protein
MTKSEMPHMTPERTAIPRKPKLHMTKEQIVEALAGHATISVIRAGEILGLSKDLAYQAARENQMPVVRIGKRFLVPTEKLAAMLGFRPEAV